MILNFLNSKLRYFFITSSKMENFWHPGHPSVIRRPLAKTVKSCTKMYKDAKFFDRILLLYSNLCQVWFVVPTYQRINIVQQRLITTT